MTARRLDAALTPLAAAQHGAFTWPQAQRLGMTASMASRRVESGAWRRLARGLFALTAWPTSWLQTTKAADLSVTGAAVCRRTALALRGMPGASRGQPHLTVPATRSSRSALAVLHRSDRCATERVQGIRVTTLEQTVVDVAGVLAHGVVEQVLEQGLLERLLKWERFELCCNRAIAARAPGSGMLRALLSDHGHGLVVPESELERKLYRLLGSPGIPEAVRQAAPPWRPLSTERVDASLPAWRLIIEADGRRWHTRAADFERDRRRDQLAKAHGYRVLRFTWGQITAEPAEVIAIIRATGRWLIAA